MRSSVDRGKAFGSPPFLRCHALQPIAFGLCPLTRESYGLCLRATSHRPWAVEQLDSCFVVKDLNGQALAYVYFEEEPRRRFCRELLTRDEAQRIAAILPSCRNCCASRKHRRSSFCKRALAKPLIG